MSYEAGVHVWVNHYSSLCVWLVCDKLSLLKFYTVPIPESSSCQCMLNLGTSISCCHRTPTVPANIILLLFARTKRCKLPILPMRLFRWMLALVTPAPGLNSSLCRYPTIIRPSAFFPSLLFSFYLLSLDCALTLQSLAPLISSLSRVLRWQ